MAITTAEQMRSIAPLPFYTVDPGDDGVFDEADQIHTSFLFRDIPVPIVAALAAPTAHGREEVFVVALTIEGDMSSQTFHFSPKLARPVNLNLGLDVRPYLLTFGGRPTRIDSDKAITERGSISMAFADDAAAPDFDSTVFTIFKGGSFWRRLVVAQPDFIGSAIEVRRGFLPLIGGFSAMRRIFRGRVEKIDFTTDGSIQLVAKDILALQDRLVPAEISDENQVADTTSSTTSVVFVDDASEVTDPASLESKDFFPVTVRLEPDSIPFVLSSATWTVATRVINQAGAFAGYEHRDGDQVFLIHASITDGLFEIQGKIDDGRIILTGEIFASDLTGVTSKPFEDIILASVDTVPPVQSLSVEQNFADKSEDFADAAHTKSGVTVTSKVAVGPFGTSRADLLTFPIGLDFIEQDTGEAGSGADWVGALWFKRSPNLPLDGTITIELRNSTGSQIATNTLTFTDRWARFEVGRNITSGDVVLRIVRGPGDASEVLVYGMAIFKAQTSRGFYVATDTAASVPPGINAGRGAFGTQRSGHAIGTPYREILEYEQQLAPRAAGVHQTVVLRDLVNRGGVAAADVDETSFGREFNFIETALMRRGGSLALTESTRLLELIKRVRQQGLMDLWVSEDGLVTMRLSFRQNLPGVTVKQLTHEENLLFRTTQVRNNAESRITRIFIFFDPLIAKPEQTVTNFRQRLVRLDVAVEAASGPKARRIFADFLFRQPDAVALAGRLLGRFKRGARILTTDLDMTDEPDFTVGDVVSVDSPDILLAGSSNDAVRGRTLWQVRQRRHKRVDGQIGIEALETSGRKYGIISPNGGLETTGPFPDHDDASERERQYGFIGDSSNLLTLSAAEGGGSIEGYFIL